GDMQAIKELADRLDGKPAQILDLTDPDKPTITKIVHEFVHVNLSPEELSALNEAERHRANGNEISILRSTSEKCPFHRVLSGCPAEKRKDGRGYLEAAPVGAFRGAFLSGALQLSPRTRT